MSKRIKILHLNTCNFCGKNHTEVSKLFTANGYYICDQCVDLCHQIMKKYKAGDQSILNEGAGDKGLD